MGMARGHGSNAAVPAGARREASLRLVHPVSGDAEPARARYSGRSGANRPDLAQLKQITGCVRTYSVDHRPDQIPELPKRHGMKGLQGLWPADKAGLNPHT